MSALVIAMFGAGIGVGLLVVARAFTPRPVPLDHVAALLDRPGTPFGVAAQSDDLGGVGSRLGAIGLGAMAVLRVGDRGSLDEKLRVLDKPMAKHAYEKMLAATFGAILPLIVGVVLAAAAMEAPVAAIGLSSLALAVAGFFYPDLPLAEQVEERRRGFRHAFSAYLDLVTIALAGGAGIESALEGAAEAGDGWAFAEIRRALRRARLTRRTPWDAFDQLGTELGVNELRELAASISLAGDHGARVKASLAAKADALRSAQAAELEVSAETRTEKMIVPVVVMVLGLVLFIGFGAVDAISDGGTQFSPTPPSESGGR